MANLRREKDRLSEAVRADGTQRAYSAAWRRWAAWCADAGRDSMPATDETLALYVAAIVSEGGSPRTAEVGVSAVNDAHRRSGLAAVAGPETDLVLRGARRSVRDRPGGKAALTVPELRRMLRAARAAGGPAAVRDIALLLLGFATGCRRSELAALDVADVVAVPRKGLRVLIRRSKTDQVGDGREVGIPPGSCAETCPVRAVRAWLRVRGAQPGPLFVAVSRSGSVLGRRLHPASVAGVVKHWAASAGLDPDAYAAHSLRSGMVTAGAELGANPLVIMQRTGHRSVKTVQRYFRPVSCFGADPLAKAL